MAEDHTVSTQLDWIKQENASDRLRTSSLFLEDELEKEIEAKEQGDPALQVFILDRAILKQQLDTPILLPFEWVNQATAVHQLTPLHFAAIAGNLTAAAQLLELKADPNAFDWRRWTPLHHAALFGNEEIIRLLLTNGSDPSLKNDWDGSFEDILRLTWVKLDLSHSPIPLYYTEKFDGTGEQLQQLTAEGFYAIAHCRYIEENVVTKARIFHDWQNKDAVEKSWLDGALRHRYAALDEPQPFHILTEFSGAFSQNGIDGPPGLGLLAGRKLAPLDIIGEFKGVYAQEYPKKSSYRINEGPEPVEYGNEISRVNDGFPNAALVKMTKCKGMPCRFLLIALDFIEAGKELCFDYGLHRVKFGPYIEIRQKELREFIKERGSAPFAQAFAEENSDLGFDAFVLQRQLGYLLHTPPVIFSLILDRTITPAGAKELLALADARNLCMKELDKCFDSLISVGTECLKILEKIEEVDPALETEIGGYLQALPSRTIFPHALQIAETLAMTLQKSLQGDFSKGRLGHLWRMSKEIFDGHLSSLH